MSSLTIWFEHGGSYCLPWILLLLISALNVKHLADRLLIMSRNVTLIVRCSRKLIINQFVLYVSDSRSWISGWKYYHKQNYDEECSATKYRTWLDDKVRFETNEKISQMKASWKEKTWNRRTCVTRSPDSSFTDVSSQRYFLSLDKDREISVTRSCSDGDRTRLNRRDLWVEMRIDAYSYRVEVLHESISNSIIRHTTRNVDKKTKLQRFFDVTRKLSLLNSKEKFS